MNSIAFSRIPLVFRNIHETSVTQELLRCVGDRTIVPSVRQPLRSDRPTSESFCGLLFLDDKSSVAIDVTYAVAKGQKLQATTKIVESRQNTNGVL